MFGLFKNKNKFNSLRSFEQHCLKQLEDTVIYAVKKSPDEFFASLAVVTALGNCSSELRSRIPEIARLNNWDEIALEKIISHSYSRVYDKYLV
jgi:hypothetical protein